MKRKLHRWQRLHALCRCRKSHTASEQKLFQPATWLVYPSAIGLLTSLGALPSLPERPQLYKNKGGAKYSCFVQIACGGLELRVALLLFRSKGKRGLRFLPEVGGELHIYIQPQ